ncbi:DUF6231 family protein [Psychrobacter sp. B38]|uniref:DUF6231 family protein n=1 Tax=Psychrobacter sp. B38 TaxID=3143538 RepID=UPI00320D3E0F
MTKHSATHSDITLPLLIEYVDALMPSLAIQNNTAAPNQSQHSKELLWAVQDKNTHSALTSALKSHMNNQDNRTATDDAQKSQISTVLELNQQQTTKRYALACFWLPTLSSELLQHYIPLIMRYRDLYAAHLLIALDNSIDLNAYGFTPFDILNEQSLDINNNIQVEQADSSYSSATPAKLWQFNLYDYKKLPNWLNADYWANPENWDKNRW